MIDLTPIAYEVGGTRFQGYLADGSGGRRVPGIVVAHEGLGLTEHPKERARMLAELGYVAFAMDTFGKPIGSVDEAMATTSALAADLPTLRARAAAALGIVKAHAHVDPARTGAIGFCFGGTTVLELARSGADVGCVVGFHSGLATGAPGDARNVTARVMVCLGADDPLIPAAQREAFAAEMTAGKVDWQMHLYGGVGHSFTNRDVDAFGLPGFAYDANADRRSWAAMRGLFDEVFTGA